MRRTLRLVAGFVWTVALSAQNGPPLRMTSAVVIRTGPFYPGQVEEESEFLTTDPGASWGITYTGGKKGDKLRIEWTSPAGSPLAPTVIDLSGPNGTWVGGTLRIAGAPPSTMPGKWELQVYYNDQKVSWFPFTISRPPNTVVNLVSQTVLASATMNVPYFLQLRASGGSPPYRWSVAGNVPPGMSLSPAGELTGTPTRRGTYRVAVRAEDSAGNAVTRTLGLGVFDGAVDRRAAARVITKSPSAQDACAAEGIAKFLTTDLTAWVAFSVDGAKPDDNGEIQWLNPFGEVEDPIRFTRQPDERRCYLFNLPIAGAKAASMPGNWRFRVLWRNAEILSIPFQISDGSEAAVPGRHALVVGNGEFQNLPAISSAAADTAAVAQALRQDGFEVTEVRNPTNEELRAVETDFAGKLQKGDVALVYYTGYGFQRGGDNWLPATNFAPADPRPTANAYSVTRLHEALGAKGVRLAVIVLDAARELPVLASRSQGPGLARMTADAHTVFVYSVPPGRTEARTQNASPGPFAQAFIKAIRTERTGIRQLLQADLPKAAAALAPNRPAATTLLETNEEFVFRTPSVSQPVEFAPGAAGAQLSGVWEFGNAAGTNSKMLPGPRCKLNFTLNRGAFGNVIERSACAESFWRMDGEQLFVMNPGGYVTTIFSKTPDGYWIGPFFRPEGIMHYLKRPGTHKQIAIDPKILDSYVGKYQFSPAFAIIVTNEGGHLFAQGTGQQKAEVFPEINRDFFAKVVDAQFTFETDREGKTVALVLHQNGKDQRAKRIE